MILVDANVLIYAVDEDSPHHAGARQWLESALSGTTPVGLAWSVLLAFVRITTRAGLFEHPLSAERALAYVDSWLDQPFVQLVTAGEGHWPILRTLLRETGTTGNLTSDAHLAALAIEHRATLCSTDHDFRRFPGLDHRDPLR